MRTLNVASLSMEVLVAERRAGEYRGMGRGEEREVGVGVDEEGGRREEGVTGTAYCRKPQWLVCCDIGAGAVLWGTASRLRLANRESVEKRPLSAGSAWRALLPKSFLFLRLRWRLRVAV